MSLAPERLTIGLRRLFTAPGVNPYDEVVWERRDARITNWKDGAVAFEQPAVEFPVGWSLNATNIVAQKYFRGTLGTPERESSLKQVIDRVADTITRWGHEGGYFVDDDEEQAFINELKYILVTQRAAFNSPVWFNIGVAGVPQQAAACYILAVDDTMDSILNWYREEGIIFKGGSGFRGQPVQDPLQSGAPPGWRNGVGAGELHARCRLVGGHDQVRGQDPARGQDGDPQRRPSRRRGVHLVQGQGGAQGPRASRRRVRHGSRRRRLVLRPVPERQQLGTGHRRVHAGRQGGRRLGARRRHDGRGAAHRASPGPVAPDRRGGLGVRRPRAAVRHHNQQMAHRSCHRSN